MLMNSFSKIIAAVVTLCFLVTGCGYTPVETGPAGKDYEVILLCNEPEWKGELGDTLRSVLEAPVEELMIYEPMYDVRQIPHANFREATKRFRNIIAVNVTSEVATPGIFVQNDRYVPSQTYIVIQGPTQSSVAEYVAEHRDEIYHVLEKSERSRSQTMASNNPATELQALIEKKFGVKMKFDASYTLRSESEDMVWISKEFTTSSQGFFIYKRPYHGKEDITAEAIIAARNKFAARIPGPLEGSYMITVDKIPDQSGEQYIPFDPTYRIYSLGDQPWIEMCGLWEVANYFMGGPYISYTTLNNKTNEVVTIDCYVYSPKEIKRNLFRELQHLIYDAEVVK